MRAVSLSPKSDQSRTNWIGVISHWALNVPIVNVFHVFNQVLSCNMPKEVINVFHSVFVCVCILKPNSMFQSRNAGLVLPFTWELTDRGTEQLHGARTCCPTSQSWNWEAHRALYDQCQIINIYCLAGAMFICLNFLL